MVLATGLCGLVYAVGQQDLRSAVNDHQEQLGREVAIRLDRGAAPATVIGPTTVDVAGSLAPFIVVYGSTGVCSQRTLIPSASR